MSQGRRSLYRTPRYEVERPPRQRNLLDSVVLENGSPLSESNHWVVRQFTANKRLARSLKVVSKWCRRHRHAPLERQQARLASVIRGHCNYYGVTGNRKRLSRFRYQVVRAWQKWLLRRSRKSCVNWERMGEILCRNPLPNATVMCSNDIPLANLSSEEPSASTGTLGSEGNVQLHIPHVEVNRHAVMVARR